VPQHPPQCVGGLDVCVYCVAYMLRVTTTELCAPTTLYNVICVRNGLYDWLHLLAAVQVVWPKILLPLEFHRHNYSNRALR